MSEHERRASDPPVNDVWPAEAAQRRSTFTPPTDAHASAFAQGLSSGGPVPIDAPPPVPSSAVVPPPGSVLPRAPQRRSLDDAQIVARITQESDRPGAAIDGIEQLEEQLRIRREEAHEFTRWERSMQAIGTPEALDVVEEVRTTFTEAIQVIPPFDHPFTGQSAAQAPPAAPEVPLPQSPAEGDEDASAPEWEPESVPVPVQVPVPVPVSVPSATPTPTPATAAGTTPTPAHRIFASEATGAEPTELGHRTGGPFGLFWVWLAANSSVLGLVLGIVLMTLGMSLRQAIIAVLAGVALSFLPTGLATLASKWSGQPTSVVSRASFGLVGNVLPSAFGLIAKVLWGAGLLWLLSEATAGLVDHMGLLGPSGESGLGHRRIAIIVAGGALLLALTVAFFGYRLVALTQMVLSVASTVLIILLIAATWARVDMAQALTIADGSWALVLTGAVLVFSFMGAPWAWGAGDVARYQRPTGSGATAMLSASFAVAIPPFLLIGYGAMLASSDDSLAARLMADPAAALSSLVPGWFLLPLVIGVGIGLLSSVILSVYSAAFAAQAVGLRVRRDVAVLMVGVTMGLCALAFTIGQLDLTQLFRDLATTLAVPIAAWVGIFSAEMMIRSQRFDSRSLLRPGGVYPGVNWVNLAMFIVACVVGFGFTTATAGWLAWQGYLVDAIGLSPNSALADSDFGVVVALVLGLLAPLTAGITAIRRQEAAQAEAAQTDATQTDATAVPGSTTLPETAAR